MGTSARLGLALLAGLAAAALSLSLPVGQARPARPGGELTLRMEANIVFKPAWDVLVGNFERVHPTTRVDVTYAASSAIGYQLETTELAAGNGPDLLATNPGCGTPISVCVLAKAGYLAPMIKKPWVRWSVPLVTSLAKRGPSLFAFTATVAPYGLFTNDPLMAKLGLKMPQTFAQLLQVCRKARAAGTTAVIFAGGAGVTVSYLLTALATATVYGGDKHWTAERRAGKVSFDGTAGWHRALQDFVDMNGAGCFQPGVAGTSPTGATAAFAQGQGLMLADPSNFKGQIDAGAPAFGYSFRPFPLATTLLDPGNSVSVNAHARNEAQPAAQAFVDFVARPKQDALFARLTGGITQYQFTHDQIPAFMSSMRPVLSRKRYVVNPFKTWWNADVTLVLQQQGIGLITGQRSIDDILRAMDAAWKLGPA